VTLEVLDPPRVDHLYFWALQVDFMDGEGHRRGGAHLGLQWHPGHPGSTAVNWGGYDAAGTVLTGSDSALRSATANPHTRDYAWEPVVPYRLSVGEAPGKPGAWRGVVTDQRTGGQTVVRDLYAGADRLVAVTVWSEVFARCDDPPVTIRWSDPLVRSGADAVEPSGYSVNYQSHADGGCANTDSTPDGSGVVQRTATERSTRQGAVIGTR
jgi:hypothetical protein